MNSILVTALIFFLVGSYGIPSDNLVINTEAERVKLVVSDFNRVLFVEMEPQKAIEKHFYLSEGDSTDKTAGFDSSYPKITKNIDRDIKTKYFALEFYFEQAVPILAWALRRSNLSVDAEFMDEKILEMNNGELEKLWENVLKDFGEPLDDDLEQNVELHSKFAMRLSSAIGKQGDENLLIRNLRLIDEQMTISSQKIGGREYFTVANKLFTYKVAIKNDVPKIMRISRNYS